MSICVKICKYLKFGQNFPKISIFIKIFKNIDFSETCWKSETSKNIDVDQNSPKCRFWS